MLNQDYNGRGRDLENLSPGMNGQMPIKSKVNSDDIDRMIKDEPSIKEYSAVLAISSEI